MKNKILENEIVESIAKDLSDDIDFGVMKSLLTESGWYVVELPSLVSREESIDIKDWIATNCKEGDLSRGKTFLFKSSKEAEWFSLRWL